MAMLKSFWTDESGQGMTEYAVIVGIVALGLMLIVAAFRDQVGRVFRMVRLELMTDATEQVGQVGVTDGPGVGSGGPGTGTGQGRPGLGQGRGCPSVGGCKPGNGGK